MFELYNVNTFNIKLLLNAVVTKKAHRMDFLKYFK